MKDTAEHQEVPGMGAVQEIAQNSPNDDARRQVANKDPNRYCKNTPYVPDGGDSMKGEY